MKLIVSFIALFVSLFLFAESKYDYLKKFDKKPAQWDVEKVSSSPEEVKETRVDLSQYYKDFFSDGEIYFYYGVGYQAYSAQYSTSFFEQVKAISEKEKLGLIELKLSDDKNNVSFYDVKGNYYSIDFGHERDAFARSFSDYEVVMYHGHSRYGRGPAFENFWNYFRMGHVFETIEVNAENPYFVEEEILKQDEFPLQSTEIAGKQCSYQYKGGKVESSYMTPETFTKNIAGWDTDLVNTDFYSGRQLFYLYSCRNVHYFKKAIRELFPNTNRKFVFGTKEDGWWGTSPAAVFVTSIVKRETDSEVIVKAMNDVKDCPNDCFTSY